MLLLIAVIGFLACTNAQISSSVLATELESTTSAAKAILKSPSSLRDAYYASQLLKSLDSKGISCNCGTLTAMVAGVKAPLDVFFGLSAGDVCGCSGISAPKGAEDAIKENLQVGL